jgi:hypothetical protein
MYGLISILDVLTYIIGYLRFHLIKDKVRGVTLLGILLGLWPHRVLSIRRVNFFFLKKKKKKKKIL